MGANDIEFNSGTQITLNADGTSDKYILANGNNIEYYTNGVHLFDLSAAISVFRIKHSGSNTFFSYTEFLNSDNDKIAKFYADNKVELSNKTFTFRENGTTIGLPFTLNGGVDNFVGTRKVAWGESTALGAVCVPAKSILQKVFFSINERITTPTDSGVLTLRYRKNPITGVEATTSIGTFTATTDVFSQTYTMGASHTFDEEDRIEIEVVNTSWSKTAAEGMIVLWFTTNE
jgi:hypothetical protein